MIMSSGFFGIFFAFNTSQSLQTSLNAELGDACLASLYAAFTVVCIPGPRLVGYLGPKLSMIIGGSMYVAMIFANVGIFHLQDDLGAQYALGIPFNLLVGIGAPLLWTGQMLYLTQCAQMEADETGGSQEDTKGLLSDYNAIFFTFFQANGVMGLLLQSLLSTFDKGSSTTTILFIILGIACAGGVFILSTLPSTTSIKSAPTPQSGNMAYGDVLADDAEEEAEVGLVETLLFMVRESRMYFFIPIVFYNGMSLSFVFGDYTKYVTCESLDLKNVGFVTATFYGVNTIASMSYGRESLLKIINRKGLMIMAAAVQILFFIVLLIIHKDLIGYHNSDGMSNFVPCTALSSHDLSVLSTPDKKWSSKCPDSGWTCAGKVVNGTAGTPEWQCTHADASASTYGLIFVGAIIFAIGDAVWESVVPAVIQGYFVKDGDVALNSANANLKLWQSLGFAVWFVVGALFPQIDPTDKVLDYFWLKVVILLGCLVVGTVAVLIIVTKYPVDEEEKAASSMGGVVDGDERLLDDSK